ncbi:MAG: FkbM family methyltransferase [Pseudotabrizicola sp.]|uniref:FkbM family methyltransferase n=1 Tax=Pseudotabrizicola sp. TaxID=2939647 RepID=UPI002719859E|nr:FkbM family methyltransferase [Pseudotabrizicola sp.]MDO8885139.1 FkbM family methyltransferase [Pseudotabrizicola sp.]MDP2082642.1 FkbM family methyltransferase [Pseudotabrizicola sp.]MDZ7573538.1 FkbM family methyltransferase [Pseudotabrizicola sp.]
MQAKRVLGVVPLSVPEEVADQTAAMSEKMEQMIKLMDESVHLQRVALLEDGHILRFHSGLARIALSLPDAQDDYVQRVILRARQFYEARLLAAVQSMGLIKPDATVCDIGANIGNASVFFGKVLGAKRVLAFEPQPHCYATLNRNLELNALTDAQAYNCMVGATSGRGDVARFNPRNLGATRFAAAKNGPVPMVALDDLIEAEELHGLTFIKIDVEGMHLEVLSGAKKVIKAFKPAIWAALSEGGADYAATAKVMQGLGYTATQIGPNDHIFTPKK